MTSVFSRRNFLQTAAIGAGAAVLPDFAAASEVPAINRTDSTNDSPLKLGLASYLIGSEWDLDTIIANCTQTKYVHAELRTTHKHGIEVSLNKNQRTEVKNKIKNSALEAISLASAFMFHFPDKKILRENIEGAKEYLQLAADVGAIGIRVFPNDLPDNVPEEKTMEQIGKSLSEIGKVGHNLGVDVRLEVHGRKTNQVHVIKKIIDYSESPHVYVTWNSDRNDLLGDGFHANFNLVKDRIKGVHMRDLYLEDYPYRELFKLLRENGFQGYCNIELGRISCEPLELMKYYRALFLALQNAF